MTGGDWCKTGEKPTPLMVLAGRAKVKRFVGSPFSFASPERLAYIEFRGSWLIC